jgi:hypothetical protein
MCAVRQCRVRESSIAVLLTVLTIVCGCGDFPSAAWESRRNPANSADVQDRRQDRSERAAKKPEGPGYGRAWDDPFEKYSFDNVQALVEEIRSQGRPIPTGHPRIFINENNKAELRDKIGRHHLAWMQELVNLAEQHVGVTITEPGAHSKEPPGQPVVLANAIIYQLGPIPRVRYRYRPEKYGEEGVRHLVDMAKLDTNYIHIEYLGLPLAYDWLFELMTDEQRQTVADTLLKYAHPNTERVKPYNNPPGARLLGALALHGDSQYADQEEVNRLLDLFYNGMVFGDPHDLWKFMGEPRRAMENGRNFTVTQVFTPHGPGIEGLGYSHWYNPFYPILLAWRDQTGEDYFQLPFFRNWVEHFTHLTGNSYQHQDKWWHAEDSLNYRFPRVQVWLEPGLTPKYRDWASLSKHHLYQNNAIRFVRPSSRAVYMLLADPTVPAQSPAQLNMARTKHFEGVNNVLTRSSWSGTDATWVWFQSPTWANVRNGGPLNDLLIWKNGAMLLGKHWNWHDGAGTNGTNTIEMYDREQPGKTFVPATARGSGGLGRRLVYGESIKGLTRDLEGYQRGLRYFVDRPGDSLYAFGDGEQTLHEDDDTRNKIEIAGWSRQLVYFRPQERQARYSIDVFVVFDRIEKDRDTLVEHLPWHYGTNPEIRDRATNSEVGEGRKLFSGVYQYEEGDRIVTTVTTGTPWGRAHARLFTDTLWPRNPVYFRLGGVEERNVDLFGNLREKNLRVKGDPNDPKNIVQGLWRVQVTAPKPTLKQTYLHVMQACDSSMDKPYETVLLEGEGLVGAAVGERIALFHDEEAELTSGSLRVPPQAAGRFRLLAADLLPGADYELSIGNDTQIQNAGVAGTASFDNVVLQAGDRVTIRKVESP